MVYADVAVASKKKKPLMPSALDLDDSHVEYAQILQQEKIMKPGMLPQINKGDSKHGMRGGKSLVYIHA